MSNKRDILSSTSQIVVLVNLESFYFTHSKKSMSLNVVNKWTLESICQCLAGSESLHWGKQKKNDTQISPAFKRCFVHLVLSQFKVSRMLSLLDCPTSEAPRNSLQIMQPSMPMLRASLVCRQFFGCHPHVACESLTKPEWSFQSFEDDVPDRLQWTSMN